MTLDCTLSVEQVGTDIEIEFTATNIGEEAVELTFSDGQTIEVVASRVSRGDTDSPSGKQPQATDDEEIWRYSDGRMFTQALRMETLAPGEQLIETVTWEDPPAGGFEIRSWFCANDADCAATGTTTI